MTDLLKRWKHRGNPLKVLVQHEPGKQKPLFEGKGMKKRKFRRADATYNLGKHAPPIAPPGQQKVERKKERRRLGRGQ